MDSDDSDPSGFPWSAVLLVLLLLVMAAIVIPNFVRARTISSPNACINNLKQIDGAKEQWALENQKQSGYRVTSNDVASIVSYLKNSQMPTCYANGTYTVGDIGQPPRCSVPSHTL